MSLRLLRGSRATGQATEGIEIRESDRVASPVALGIVRPAIVLPADWRQWDGAKLDAVLAHERSHIRRHDPAVQLLSAIHRALLWHSPLSWFLHQRIVRVAEEASDDAAVAVTRDRAFYAEVLLEFMQRGGAKRELAGSADGAVWPAGRAHPSHSGWDGAIARSYAMERRGDSGIGIAAGVHGGGGSASACASREALHRLR